MEGIVHHFSITGHVNNDDNKKKLMTASRKWRESYYMLDMYRELSARQHERPIRVSSLAKSRRKRVLLPDDWVC